MKESNRHTKENKSDSLQHTQMLAAMDTAAKRGTHYITDCSPLHGIHVQVFIAANRPNHDH
jgi:hypothetical protein